MRRREVTAGFAAAMAALPLRVGAQQAGRNYRVGILMDGPVPALNSFRRRMNELGYTEGRNLQLLERWTDAQPARAARVAAELATEKPDAIVTYGTRATLAIKEATTAIPVVTAAVSDEFSHGIFRNLARPGGNVTGFVSLSASLWNKRLALAKQLLPQLSQVAYLAVPGAPNSPGIMRTLSEAGKSFGMTVEALEMSELGLGLARVLKERRYDAVLVSTGDAFRHRAGELTRLIADLRLPAFYGARDFADAGGLISYGPDYNELFRRTADYLDRILRGEKPGDLPAQQAERFELVINLKTARALGLTIPPTLLARADEVIE
jgi:putative ABC transport system substrate-binding protein